MSSVDDRIVNMQFNNKQFSAGVTDSQRSLQDLEKTLAGAGSSTGGLSQMASGIEGATSKFGALKIAGISAIATIASKATLAGISMVKSMTLDPITAGFAEYQTNLNSIQTIIANTGAGVNEVNGYLEQLNHYSDQTIYNFSQMASAIGKFTAAGVGLDDATSAIKGMANSAALSGADVNQLNSAMYQMSQALASGTIKLMDWNSLVNANMGGKNMQESLKATAMSMKDGGEAMQAATANGTAFRDSLQAGWLTADIFTKSMKVMGGQTINTKKDLETLGMTQEEFEKSGHKMGDTVAFTVEQLKEMGYADKAAKDLHKLSGAAISSAQDIKTIPQLLDVVKESIGSGWAKIFQDLFGNFEEAKAMWTSVGNSITGVIGNIFGSVDKMLLGWRKLGGYQELWGGFGNIFKAIGNLLKPVINLFQAITPSTGKAGEGLFTITHAFFVLTEWLLKASEGISKLTPLFQVIGTVIGVVFRQVSSLVSILSGALAPVFDELSKRFGDFQKQGMSVAQGLLQGILSGLNGDAIKSAVIKFALGIVDWIKGALGIHSPAAELVPVGFNIVAGIAEGIVKGISVIGTVMGKVIVAVFNGVSKLFKGFDAMDWASLLNALLAGGLLYSLKKGADAVTSFRDVLKSITGVIDEVGNSLKAWQNSLKAKMIMDIAIAVGILVASIIALSFIDPKKIAISIGAIVTLLGSLSATLLALSKIDSDRQMAVLAASLLLISTAMLQMAAAVAIFGNMDMETLAKGIGSMSAVLGLMVGSMMALAGLGPVAKGAGTAMVLMAVAMNIMAGAIALLGNMNVATLAKGLGAVAIGLSLMVGALETLTVLGKGVFSAAAALVLVAGALTIMAAAVGLFGKMNMKTLYKGFGAVAVGLGLMVGALLVLSGNTAGVLAGAGAMVLMATAMNIMVGVILLLGAAPWEVVARGIGFVAATLAIFLLAAAAAIPLAPGLWALGTSMLMLGAAMALAGIGMTAFGTGFALLAATGAAGTAVLVGVITALLALLPSIAIQAAAAFVAFVRVVANASDELRVLFGRIFENMIGVISDNIPVIVDLIVELVSELLSAATKLLPKWGTLISTYITTALRVLTKAVPQFTTAGVKIISGVLQGIADEMPGIIRAGGDLVVNFIEGLGAQGVRIANATGRTILSFLRGLDDAIVTYEPQIIDEGFQIAGHLIDGLVDGLRDSLSWDRIKGAVMDMANALPGWARKVLGIDSPSKVFKELGIFVAQGMASGITKGTIHAIIAVTRMANAVVAAGNKAVLRAQKAARRVQNKAYEAQAKADIKADEARAAARYANQHKKDKEAQKRAKLSQRQADRAQSQADKAQKAADASAQHVSNVRDFAEADLHGKGDIRNQQAVALADRANKQLAKANAEAARARELMKTNRKAGRAMLEQARKDAQIARNLAKQARHAHDEAQKYYEREVANRIKQIQSQNAADEKARKDQAKYDAADAQGKSDILTKRAEENEAKAKEQKALAKRLMAQAKKIADTNAAKAMKLLDRAEKASQKAQDAADQAASDRDEAEQVLQQGSTGGSTTTGGSITPSRIALEDAAKVVDRYTESLRQASEMAAAEQRIVQFVQNNNSPVALTASEIYRQSKNLLSAAEVKMGVTVD